MVLPNISESLPTWLNLFPPYLIILTIVCVFLPTLWSMVARINLYAKLKRDIKKVTTLLNGNKEVAKPVILKELEKRFEVASKHLEHINTPALITGLYPVKYDQIDYWCRVLPNLLLSFGLLGTFLGITLNLSNLSQTITQMQNTDINDLDHLLSKLQEPLQSMGIAFITSLVAVVCSSFLTIINLRFNTSLAKYQLVGCLEDYLDNVYYPQLEGQTRLDKVIGNMANTFDGFLTRFGDTVRRAVEDSFRDTLKQFSDENIKASKLAEQVYYRLLDASGSISQGANDFQAGTSRFQATVKSLDTIDLPAQLAQLSKIQSSFSDSANTLATNINSQLNIMTDLTKNIDNLTELEEKLYLKYQQLDNSINDKIGENNQFFQATTEKLTQNINSFAQVITHLKQIEKEFNNLTTERLSAVLTSQSEAVNQRLENWGDLITLSVDEQIKNNSKLMTDLQDNIDKNTLKISLISDDLNQYVNQLEGINSKLNQLIQSLNNKKPPSISSN